ncbi:trichohyalin-like [Anoplophora glabripennis]|uniref:trichohyalin-like n=1 Tax=Anoplophora glabripennis TaxID=217634 RepID=UPI000874BB8D|nr:trichohyalin-like [Anoplophora glabripennis]
MGSSSGNSSSGENYKSTEMMSTDEAGRGTRDLTVKLGKRGGKERKEREEDRDESSEEPARIRRKSMKMGEEEEIPRKSAEDERVRVEAGIKKRIEEETTRRHSERQREMERKMEEQKRQEREEKKIRICEQEEDGTEAVQKELERIMEATGKENGGKITFTRGDQITVRDAVYKIQNQIINILRNQVKLEKKLHTKNEGKEIQDVGRMSEKRVNVRRKEKSRGVMTEDSDTEEWKERPVRRRRKTYAEASKGTTRERIEGRVVVVGEEGWKTPPQKKATETALIVSSKEESDARKLAEALAKQVSVKDIGGAPQGVRKIRDGKVVIIPRYLEQKGKIKETLEKMQQVEVRESRRSEPLLMVSGVEKGLTDQELTEKLLRGFEGSVNVERGDLKVLKRVACRNNWKENIVLKTSIENSKL